LTTSSSVRSSASSALIELTARGRHVDLNRGPACRRGPVAREGGRRLGRGCLGSAAPVIARAEDEIERPPVRSSAARSRWRSQPGSGWLRASSARRTLRGRPGGAVAGVREGRSDATGRQPTSSATRGGAGRWGRRSWSACRELSRGIALVDRLLFPASRKESGADSATHASESSRPAARSPGRPAPHDHHAEHRHRRVAPLPAALPSGSSRARPTGGLQSAAGLSGVMAASREPRVSLAGGGRCPWRQ
ncbi:MAG: hypothetical protein QOE59_1671, partial [Actinomycetota bacterium]|nr:hypothetical protein [Actinomycetota bacterium]